MKNQNWKSLNDYSASESDVVWLKLKTGQVLLGCYWDCQWMRDDPEEYDHVNDCFTKWENDDGNQIELSEVESWAVASNYDKWGC